MHPTAQKMLADIRDAACRRDAVTAIKAFTNDFAAKWPKAAAKIVDDADQLLAFYDFPAEHWVHLKTSNPIESPSRLSASAPRSPRDPAHEQLGWPWPSS